MLLSEVQRRLDEPPFNQVGLYIAQQILPAPYDKVYRCGVGGSKESFDIDPSFRSKGSTIGTRMMMYWNNWISDGRIHACITIPRQKGIGKAERILAGDSRMPDYARPFTTRVLAKEREFHAILDKMRGVQRARGPRVEFFRAEYLDLLKRALRAVGDQSALFYDFRDNNVPVPKQISKRREQRTQFIDLRRSPRKQVLALTQRQLDEMGDDDIISLAER